MSEAGRVRFIEELNSYPFDIQYDVMLDLLECILHRAEDVSSSYILPRSISKQLHVCESLLDVMLAEADSVTESDLNIRDMWLFGEPYDEFKYWPGGFRDCIIPLADCLHIVKDHHLYVHDCDIDLLEQLYSMNLRTWWANIVALSISRPSTKFSPDDLQIHLSSIGCDISDDSYRNMIEQYCEANNIKYEILDNQLWIDTVNNTTK